MVQEVVLVVLALEQELQAWRRLLQDLADPELPTPKARVQPTKDRATHPHIQPIHVMPFGAHTCFAFISCFIIVYKYVRVCRYRTYRATMEESSGRKSTRTPKESKQPVEQTFSQGCRRVTHRKVSGVAQFV